MKVHVKTNERYRSLLKLGGLERFASDDMVKAHFEEVGCVNVSVVGEGEWRWAFGTWPGEEQDVELPGEVTRVDDMGPAT